MKKVFIALLLMLFVTPICLSSAVWEDQVVYFLMIDRFSNGDPSNDDMGLGEAGSDNSRYNGGDLKGIIDKLDYIKGLGATAIWITPPVANQWWNPWVNYGGYHGYWARDFKRIDEHFGDIALYKELVEKAHEKGLLVIQDIVPNHVGDYFRFVDGEFEMNSGSVPSDSPEQYPFSLNNFVEHRDENIYHWTPDISNFNDQDQKFNYQMSGLDDLNTENPSVISALKDSYTFWIDEADIDGFRIDTVIYVPHEFWREFLNGESGVYEIASKNGKLNFLTFGEAWVRSDPFEDTGERVIGEFFESGMNAMLDFPLNIELRSVLKEGKPTANLGYRLETRQSYFDHTRLLTFIDNHDMERFLKGAGLASLKQALAFIFTVPGIPVVYYGTEQGFVETRAAMFEDGFQSGGLNHFETQSELYKYTSDLAKLRLEHPALRYGRVEVLKSDPNGPGIFAYSLEHGNEKIYVIMNTAGERRILANMESGLAEGQVIKPIYTFNSLSKSYPVDENGKLLMTMNPRSVYVGVASEEYQSVESPEIQFIANLEYAQKIASTYTITGTASGASSARIIFDARIEEAEDIEIEDGQWSYEWDISKFDPGIHSILFKVYGRTKRESIYSEDYTVVLDIPELLLSSLSDPEGDDKGPEGRYEYPTDISFKNQMDLLGVELRQIGASLSLNMRIKDLTDTWGPQNGFDHVTFQIFIDDPHKTGSTVLPFLNATMPAGLDWDYFIFANGWSIVAYSAEGSGPKSFGTAISPTPLVQTNKMKSEVVLRIPGETIGRPESLNGFKVYITTWDFDGIEAVYRDIYPEPKSYHFGGGSKEDPYIMDDILLKIGESD
ncbi:alpha-amylase family glycosyl hydrolase [Mesotoga prima]|uniref:alpha-amylase family glycosyl hydrolase n=1 Tax=Mesotoga prima TaxID=1184387 RepID=UPI002C174756|nr:alpha-amylase family glycosyl hydrolase [Mesotoga prima]HPJ32120.1 alpha-amylase family glycosyl hydrolase [Mesotoga prima]